MDTAAPVTGTGRIDTFTVKNKNKAVRITVRTFTDGVCPRRNF